MTSLPFPCLLLPSSTTTPPRHHATTPQQAAQACQGRRQAPGPAGAGMGDGQQTPSLSSITQASPKKFSGLLRRSHPRPPKHTTTAAATHSQGSKHVRQRLPVRPSHHHLLAPGPPVPGTYSHSPTHPPTTVIHRFTHPPHTPMHVDGRPGASTQPLLSFPLLLPPGAYQ